MATVETVTRRDLETQLIAKAWKDPVFRTEVIRDPKGLLEKYTGQKLPDQVTIIVHEETANTLHFSIPPAPSNVSELSDEDLAKIAGGTDVILTAIVSGIGLAVSAAGTGVVASGILTAQKGW
jgi:hypothetical protein